MTGAIRAPATGSAGVDLRRAPLGDLRSVDLRATSRDVWDDERALWDRLLATWAGALSPDLSWDGLAYHLPEARDIAVSGRVRPLPDLHPQSLLWRGHDAWLALAFLAGGPHAESAERIVQLLQFGTGLFVFGAALSLARRLGVAGASPLIVLALAAFPTAMLQLRSAYVDWPAALVVTAAAAQIAALLAEGESIHA